MPCYQCRKGAFLPQEMYEILIFSVDKYLNISKEILFTAGTPLLEF
jgi:hypothetical protein